MLIKGETIKQGIIIIVTNLISKRNPIKNDLTIFGKDNCLISDIKIKKNKILRIVKIIEKIRNI